MNYPVLQVNKNGQATTSVFRGINRLPEGAEGEGAEFCNLSLDLYPAAATSGLSETNETVYIKNSKGADEAIDLSLLQAVGDITDKDGVLYLTGVYNGGFYYRGILAEYYEVAEHLELSANDKVEIEKIASTYVIKAIKESGRSSVLSYNAEAVATHLTKERESQGKLTSKVVKCYLPTPAFSSGNGDYNGAGLYIYKASVYSADMDYISEVEMNSGKTYYIMFMNEYYHLNYSKPRYYSKNKEEEAVYDTLDNYAGMGMVLEEAGNGLSKDYYCFDDAESEHPVKFVIDAAGNKDLSSRLFEREKKACTRDGGWQDYETKGTSAAGFYIHRDLSSTQAQINELEDDGSYQGGKTYLRNLTKGIIGHFEKWNDVNGRYEFFDSEDHGAIWKRVDSDGNELRAKRDTFSYYPVYDGTNNHNYTMIKVKSRGIETEGTKISHMTTYKGRIIATLNDGSMLVASALGDYTEFSEFQGVSTDSGYFNSLTAGKYTGISEYQGTLVVFKVDRMSIYYGDTPSDMALSHEIKNVGCIDAESIKECAGSLIFLGKGGFYAYTGGQPQCISRKLAKEYKSAKAFVSGRKYYAEADGELLIYDADTGAWTSSDITGIKDVCGERIFLSDGRIMKTEGNVDWSGEWVYESMDMFEDMTEDKGINEIYIRAKLQGKMTVKTITDGEMREHMTIEDDGERMKVWRVPVRFLHGNYYRIRLEGEGKCILYAVERKCYAGGKKR